MSSLNDLKLSNKPLGDDAPGFDDIPAERGAFAPPPDPGSYRFTLPKVINEFDVVQTDKYGERINVIFGGQAPLVIAQAPAGSNTTVGEAYDTRLSNVPRPRGKEKVLVSDLDYLLKALGDPKKPVSNQAYAQAIQKHAGQSFGAEVEWSWACNPKRAARWLDTEGGLQKVEDPESTLTGEDAGFKAGCGTRVYQNDVQKVEGKFPLYITCSNEACGAQVRAFSNLRNFKP